MGHYTALETLKKIKQPSNLSEKLKSVKASSKIRTNVILFALVKSGKVDICLSEMSIQLKNYSKQFDFTPVYSFEVIQGLEEAVEHDEQARKGFRTKARDGDFIEFKLILMEFFKNFDQNSNQKTKLLPIGKVDRFQ